MSHCRKRAQFDPMEYDTFHNYEAPKYVNDAGDILTIDEKPSNGGVLGVGYYVRRGDSPSDHWFGSVEQAEEWLYSKGYSKTASRKQASDDLLSLYRDIDSAYKLVANAYIDFPDDAWFGGSERASDVLRALEAAINELSLAKAMIRGDA